MYTKGLQITDSGICQRRKLTLDYTVGRLYPWVPHPKIQPITDWKYIYIFLILGSSKKQNLNLPHASNYLHSIYIVIGIISNVEMI